MKRVKILSKEDLTEELLNEGKRIRRKKVPKMKNKVHESKKTYRRKKLQIEDDYE